MQILLSMFAVMSDVSRVGEISNTQKYGTNCNLSFRRTKAKLHFLERGRLIYETYYMTYWVDRFHKVVFFQKYSKNNVVIEV